MFRYLGRAVVALSDALAALLVWTLVCLPTGFAYANLASAPPSVLPATDGTVLTVSALTAAALEATGRRPSVRQAVEFAACFSVLAPSFALVASAALIGPDSVHLTLGYVGAAAAAAVLVARGGTRLLVDAWWTLVRRLARTPDTGRSPRP